MIDPLTHLFDLAVERGRHLDPPFSNFEAVPDSKLLPLLLKSLEPAPDATREALLLARGSTYGAAARELKRWLLAQSTRSAA